MRNLLFWWNWRNTPPSGHLEDIQGELCRQSELYGVQTRREPETGSSHSAGSHRPSASLWPGTPALHKQSRWYSNKCKYTEVRAHSHLFDRLTYLRNMLSVFPTLIPLRLMEETVSTPSKTRSAFCLLLTTQKTHTQLSQHQDTFQ